MGPFPSAHFTVKVKSLGRPRPGLSCNFQIPFNQLSACMHGMHRAGFIINGIDNRSNIGSVEKGSESLSSKLKRNLENIAKTTNQKRSTNNDSKKETPRRRQRKK